MPGSNRNIDLRGSCLPIRLRRLRQEKHLTKAELALASGITARTIHDMEKDRKRRAQEKTLMALAQALDVTVDELLGRTAETETVAAPAPAAPPRRRTLSIRAGLTLLSALLVVLLLALGYLWSYARHSAEWTLEKNRLTALDGVFGMELWSLSSEAHIKFCTASPWSSDRVLVGLGNQTPDGGCLLCLDRATGDTLWVARPDIPAIVAAFGEEMVLGVNFTCRDVQPIDLDGDGSPEIAAHFVHGRYYPYALCVIGEDGVLLRQYASKGHLDDSLVTDLDGDGRQELLAAGTNNAKAYQGATIFILDRDHWSGATTDAIGTPGSVAPDSARCRIVIPAYDEHYMLLLGYNRLYATNLNVYRNTEGEAVICATIGVPGEGNLILYLDTELRPQGSQPVDWFVSAKVSQWPPSLREGTGPTDPVWRAEWLARHQRFEAGHWPPAAASGD